MNEQDYTPYSERAGATNGAIRWEEYLENVSGLLNEMPEKQRVIAGLLWSIERYGDLDHTSDPAPLHMDLAERLFAVPGAVEALKAALS